MSDESAFGPKPVPASLDQMGWLGATISVVAGACVVGVVLGILLILPRETVKPVADEDLRSYPTDPVERLDRARAVWLEFVEATDFPSRVARVRDPERVEPLMRDYYLERGHPYPTMADMSEGRFATGPSRQAVVFVVKPYEGPDYAVAVEWIDGRFVVDWEGLVAYGTMDWYELTETRPAEPQLVRVFLSPLSEERQDPRMPEKMRSYLIEDRDSPGPATLRVGPEFAGTVAWHVRGDRVPARVRVRGIEGSRSLQLVDFIGPGF